MIDPTETIAQIAQVADEAAARAGRGLRIHYALLMNAWIQEWTAQDSEKHLERYWHERGVGVLSVKTRKG